MSVPAAFDLRPPVVVTSSAAAVGEARTLASLDDGALSSLTTAWLRSRRGGWVVLSMVVTALVPLACALDGLFGSVALRDAQLLGGVCWLLSAAQGVALFAWRRTMYFAECDTHGLGAATRAQLDATLSKLEHGVRTWPADERLVALAGALRSECGRHVAGAAEDR